jgi:hypothetical protein
LSPPTRSRDDGGCAETLDCAQNDEGGEIGRQRTGYRQRDIDAEAHEQNRATPISVGKAARHQCADTRTDQIGTDDELPAIAFRPQSARQIVQRGEDGIDTERIQRHQQRHHPYQRAFADMGTPSRFGPRALARR